MISQRRKNRWPWLAALVLICAALVARRLRPSTGLSSLPASSRAALAARLTPEEWALLQKLAADHPEIFDKTPALADERRWLHAVAAGLNVYGTDCLSLKDPQGAVEAFSLSLAVTREGGADDAASVARYGLELASRMGGRSRR